jgi:hypothetical protein
MISRNLEVSQSSFSQKMALFGAATKQWACEGTANWKDLAYAVVIYSVCRLVIVLQLFVVMSCEHSVNPINNTDPMFSH